MAIQAGVWIDQRQAIVVRLSDAVSETKTIRSDVGRPGRPAGSAAKTTKRYAANDFVSEDRLERKLNSQLAAFYDEVIACVRGAEGLLIFGPGEAKRELLARLKSKKRRGCFVELEASDKLTDRQIAATVREHFATAADSTSVTPRSTLPATPRQRAKKSGK